MEEQSKMVTWDDVDTSEEQYGSFITGDELKEGLELTFLSDDMREIENKFGKQICFDVLDDNEEKRTLATRSKRLLAGLKDNAPLKDKVLFIERQGEGYDTTYKVREM
jgi:hypothetical protein